MHPLWLYTTSFGATPERGCPKKCCAPLTRNAQSDGCRGGLAGGGPDQGARARIIRPGHPPSTGHAPAGTNGRDNSRLDARRCCSRGIICERVRAPAEIWRRPVIRERAAGSVCDFAIRTARQRGPSKRVCMKPPVTISETRAVPRALGSARRPASLLRVCANSLSTRNQDAQADCTLCRLPARNFASLHVDVATCRLLSAAGRKTDAHLGYGASRNDAPNEGVADDSQHPVALRAPASTFGPGLSCESCSKRRLMR